VRADSRIRDVMRTAREAEKFFGVGADCPMLFLLDERA
jgi:hypothetical protein